MGIVRLLSCGDDRVNRDIGHGTVGIAEVFNGDDRVNRDIGHGTVGIVEVFNGDDRVKFFRNIRG